MANSAPSSIILWRRQGIAYGFAVLISALTLLVQLALSPWLGDHPAYILFILPIIFAAYVGGWGPGLLATATCAWGIYHFLLAKRNNFLFFDGSIDLWNWSSLLVCGVLVSGLIEFLHRLRKQTEAISRLHALTLASIGDAVITTDRLGRITFINAEAERLTQWSLTETRDRPLGEVFTIVNETTRQPVENPATQVLHTGRMVGPTNHTLLLGRRGQETIIDHSGAPIQEAEGGVAGVVLVFRDGSAKKREADQLAKSLSLLRATIEATQDGVLVLDTQDRITVYNSRFLEIFNVPREMASGSDDAVVFVRVLEQVLKPEPEEFVRRIREHYAAPEKEFFDVLHLRNGRIIERVSHPQRLAGKIVGRVWGFRDVTERKQAEQAVGERERLLRQVIDLVPHCIFARDQQGRFLFVNRACAEAAGLTVETMAGRNFAEFVPDPAQVELGLRADREVIASGQARFFPAMPFTDAHGVTHTLETFKTPFTMPGQHEPALLCVAVDVTERKRLEEQLRQSQKMEAIGQLAGGVAHDFNNILAVIQMQIELFRTRSHFTFEQAACVESVLNAAQRGANLTRQLLLFSRRQRLQPRELDLCESIAGTTKMFRRILGEDIQIQFKYASQPLFIHADPSMMDQVLMNLTLNSRDAMPDGGKLVIEVTAVELDATAKLPFNQARPGSFVCLNISDTGCGIPPEILPRIFEPFFTTKEVGKGTGLGLATVFSIVQQHEGWIQVASEPGNGTTFQIYLPRLARGGETPLAVVPDPGTAQGGAETILLVEDDDSLRNSFHQCLTQLGYHLLIAATGPAAWDLWQQHRGEIQLLLTDLILPGGMTGKELGERMLQENPQLKVIYISGYSSDLFSRELPAGTAFLEKPFPAQTLARTVRNCLDAHAFHEHSS